MMDTSLRTMIREVLSEEIGKAKAQGLLPAPFGAAPAPKLREEMVSIRTDGELAAFIARLVEVLRDARSREEIEKGRWVFRLGGLPAYTPGPAVSPAAPAPSTARFEKGIVGERLIEALPEGVKLLSAGRSVRFTPLAKDRLRLRGITIERIG